MYKKIKLLCVFLIIVSLFSIVFFEMKNEEPSFEKIVGGDKYSENQWESLQKKNIFIGHRSVGNNLLQGIRDYQKIKPNVNINIIDVENSEDFKGSGIFHSWIANGVSPQAIASEYIRIVEDTLKKNIDIAYLRFTPFYKKDELDIVLKDYTEAQTLLQKKYPNTIFVHGTFPLEHSKTTLKTWIKKIVGHDEIWEYRHNITANKYNELIRESYGNEKTFFDFAAIESTQLNGERSVFHLRGEKYHHMVSDYTNDGIHLNELGKIIVADRFLHFLMNLEN